MRDDAAGIWTIQAGVFPENTASLALHLALGFRVVGTRERIGCHHGVWRDVLLIERRSPTTGRSEPWESPAARRRNRHHGRQCSISSIKT